MERNYHFLSYEKIHSGAGYKLQIQKLIREYVVQIWFQLNYFFDSHPSKDKRFVLCVSNNLQQLISGASWFPLFDSNPHILAVSKITQLVCNVLQEMRGM